MLRSEWNWEASSVHIPISRKSSQICRRNGGSEVALARREMRRMHASLAKLPVMYRARGRCAENEVLYKGTLGKISGK
jgi:hypothetical protein